MWRETFLSRIYSAGGGFTSRIGVIARKEISDLVTNRIFLLAVGILLAFMILAGFTAGIAYLRMSPLVIRGASGDYIRIREQLIIVRNLDPVIRVIGALVAITIGFNTIKRESSEGSLKVLLSYPIYRDQVILGKLLGGLVVISIALASSMGISFAVYVKVAGFIPEVSTLINYSMLILLSIILLSGYLGLSILLSLAFKETKTTLLVLFFILGVFNSEILYSYGIVLSNGLYGQSLRITDLYNIQSLLNPQPLGSLQDLLASAPSLDSRSQALQDLFAGLSPAHGFTSASLALMARYRMILSGDVTTTMSYWDVMINNLRSITALILIPIITFTVSYVLFTRRDIS
jgi:ABC-2 type transport system permease protein